MLVDGGIGFDLTRVPDAVKEAESAGYDGVWSVETSHDPFLPLLLAAEHADQIQLGTGIAVAFARSPMTLAQTAYDLQAFSKGRLLLGLGSQIKPHIVKRFSMEWSHPRPACASSSWPCERSGPAGTRGQGSTSAVTSTTTRS